MSYWLFILAILTCCGLCEFYGNNEEEFGHKKTTTGCAIALATTICFIVYVIDTDYNTNLGHDFIYILIVTGCIIFINCLYFFIITPTDVDKHFKQHIIKMLMTFFLAFYATILLFGQVQIFAHKLCLYIDKFYHIEKPTPEEYCHKLGCDIDEFSNTCLCPENEW